MASNIFFVKMHGLGNDCIIVDHNDLPANCNLKALAKLICNRHTGIGADQFITYKKTQEHYEMVIYNQDGSPAKACGNASRCLVKLLKLNFGEKTMILKVADRQIVGTIDDNDLVSVNMGVVSFKESWMPKQEEIWSIAERYGFELKEVICADVGNPHLIIFSNMTNQDQGIIGEKLQVSTLFPEGVNVNFVSVSNNKIYLKVWGKRGAGFTFACGSGAIVSYAAARKLGFVRDKADVVFELGSLQMSYNNGDIIMAGSATFVAKGEFYG